MYVKTVPKKGAVCLDLVSCPLRVRHTVARDAGAALAAPRRVRLRVHVMRAARQPRRLRTGGRAAVLADILERPTARAGRVPLLEGVQRVLESAGDESARRRLRGEEEEAREIRCRSREQESESEAGRAPVGRDDPWIADGSDPWAKAAM